MKHTIILIAGSLLAATWIRGADSASSQLPKPLTAATALRLVERGALLIEDFEAPEMNSKIWRVDHRNPDRTTISQQGGRLMLTASGLVHMNGFWGLGGVKHKDLVMVGEMDVRTTGAPPHRLAFHLCGGDGARSPDHWVEILMVDLGPTARFLAAAALPVGFKSPRNLSLELPHPPGQGFLCRIELNGVTHMAEFSVKAADGWKQVCDPIELPLRTAHAELKFYGNHGARPAIPTEVTSRAWFDNVRIYPRPQSHHIGIRLVRPDGGEIWERPGGGWPPIITDAAGKVRKITDLKVELRTEDGAQLVASSVSSNFGFYLLPLKDAPWDVYPVAAQVSVLLDGKPLGKPLRIELNGCAGLYPDDVYEVMVQ
ncbi:MAG: hypothetical protein ABMA26_04960 [Limisphaerales bacterium]